MLLSEKEARAVCEKLLSFIKADDASVSVSDEIYSHLRFAANNFATSGRREDTTVSVTVWIDKKRGEASTNATDEASLRAVVEQAEQLARVSPVDREYVPTLGAQVYTPTDGFAAATADISPAARARTINDAITACERANVVGAGFHQALGTASATATKNGNFRFERTSNVSFSVTARTPDGGSSGYFLRNHFDVARLDTARVARESIRKALESRNPRELPAGVYPVILEPQAVADLVSRIAFSFDARTADEGRSAFSAPGGKTRTGEKVFDDRLQIYSDPAHRELPGSQFTQDGLPAQKTNLVRNGAIENLIYTRFWAQKQGKQPTPGPVNTIIESNAAPASLEEMIRATDRGLLISRFWYIRPVDPRTALLTGLTRDGVWFIEGGRIKHPARNFRFNQSIIGMLAPGNVEMIGAPERVSAAESQGDSAALLPALKLKAFNFTSQSEAV